MIFLAKPITLPTTSWITMYRYFCISPLLHTNSLLIKSLFSQNLMIFTSTTSAISHVAIELIGCSENHPDFR